MLFESTCVYSFTSFSETRTTFLERFLLLHTLQVLIWTLHASDIRTRPLFQKIIQNSLSLKSFSFAFLKLLKCSFSKFGALFVVSHIIIIFYFFVVSLDNIPPPDTLPWTCLKLFCINGQHVKQAFNMGAQLWCRFPSMINWPPHRFRERVSFFLDWMLPFHFSLGPAPFWQQKKITYN